MKLTKLLLAALLTTTVSSFAATYTFSVNLNGANQTPPVTSPGTGNALVTFDNTLHQMTLNLVFSGLTSGTTMAHIHCCTATPLTGNVGVATMTPTFAGFPLGVTSGTYNQSFDTSISATYNAPFLTANGSSPLSAEAALIAGALAGRAYLNIHTSNFPAGEIRGFLVTVPEPGTFMLAAAGFAVVGLVRRRLQH